MPLKFIDIKMIKSFYENLVLDLCLSRLNVKIPSISYYRLLKKIL